MKRYFSVTTNDGTAPTGESPQLLLQNPESSSRRVHLEQIIASTCVSSNNNIFRLYVETAPLTLGTPLQVVNLQSDTRPQARIYSDPTYPAPTPNYGTRIAAYCVGPTTTLPLRIPIILHPGESLLITVRPNTTGVTHSITLIWSE